MSQHSHLGLIDEPFDLGNLSPDLVFFADEVMDTLGQLLLRTKEISSTFSKHSISLFGNTQQNNSRNVCSEHPRVSIQIWHFLRIYTRFMQFYLCFLVWVSCTKLAFNHYFSSCFT